MLHMNDNYEPLSESKYPVLLLVIHASRLLAVMEGVGSMLSTLAVLTERKGPKNCTPLAALKVKSLSTTRLY